MSFVLDISVRMVVAALAVAAVLRVMRVNTAAVRHAAWTTVLGAMLLMPLLPSIVPTVPLPSLATRENVEPAEMPEAPLPGVAADSTSSPAVSVVLPTPSESSASGASATPPRGWLPYAVAVLYLAGVSLLLGRLLHGWQLASLMIRRARPCGPGPLYESAEVAVPLTAGTIRPVIVLPTAWREWPADTREAIVAHEMAHVHRRDPLISMVARVNRAIFWFHPLAWWLERQLTVTAEHACDEAAARTVAEPRRYAEILVEMADVVRRNQGRIVWQGVGVNGAGLLQGRIERVLRGSGARMSRTKTWGTLLACGAGILLVVACRQQVSATPLKEDPALAKRLAEQDENIKKSEAARDMTQAQVDELEKKLEANPQDFDIRRQLVTYYQSSSTVTWDKKVPGLRRHALWLIEHHPEHDVRPPWISPQYDPDGFAAAKKLWEAHLAKADASPYLVYRAASFFGPHDKPFAEQLIARGMKMDPDSSALAARMPPNAGGYKWQHQLAFLYASALRGSENVSGTYNDLRTHLDWLNTPFVAEVRRKLDASTDAVLLTRVGQLLVAARPGNAAQLKDQRFQEAIAVINKMGVRYLERAVELDPNLESAKAALYRTAAHNTMTEADRLANRAHERYMISEDITEHARQDPGKAKAERAEAKKECEQVLELAKSHSGDPAYSGAVMTAHQVLSALAIREGDNERAIAHLMESVKVPPSDHLRYGDPFAWSRPVNYLLKQGERERVAQFFDALAPLVGTQRRERLVADAKAIREGRMPESYQHAVYRETTPSPFKPMK